MTAVEEVVEKYRQALKEFMKVDSEPAKNLWSHRDDVSLANPLVGTPARGWEQVAQTMERAASNFREGEEVRFETV